MATIGTNKHAPKKAKVPHNPAQVWIVRNSDTGTELARTGSKYSAKTRARVEREKWANEHAPRHAAPALFAQYCAGAPITYEREL